MSSIPHASRLNLSMHRSNKENANCYSQKWLQHKQRLYRITKWQWNWWCYVWQWYCDQWISRNTELNAWM